MSLKLTDREISALGKKLEYKKRREQEHYIKTAAKKKLLEAKKIKAVLDSLPDNVLDALYDSRYSRHKMNADGIARLLIEKSHYDSLGTKDFESEVVLAAHNCSTMEALCRKLGI